MQSQTQQSDTKQTVYLPVQSGQGWQLVEAIIAETNRRLGK